MTWHKVTSAWVSRASSSATPMVRVFRPLRSMGTRIRLNTATPPQTFRTMTRGPEVGAPRLASLPSIDGNEALSCHRDLRQCHGQDTFFESGRRLPGVDRPRQRNRPRESAPDSLHAMVLRVFLLLLACLLTCDHEQP